jgi:hypothetical protein
MALFHHQHGFAEFGRLNSRPPPGRPAADDDEVIVAQEIIPSKDNSAFVSLCDSTASGDLS